VAEVPSVVLQAEEEAAWVVPPEAAEAAEDPRVAEDHLPEAVEVTAAEVTSAAEAAGDTAKRYSKDWSQITVGGIAI
jgi:hypothetical protein